MKKPVSLHIAILVGLIIFLNTGTAFAGISVTPERHILELTPGQEVAVEYQIYNSGPEDIHIEVEPKYWVRTEEDKKIDINSWLMLERGALKIKADKTKTLKIKIKAPEGVKGEMVAMIFLNYKESKDSPLNIRNGNPLYLVIKGTEEYSVKINSVALKYFTDKKRNNKKCFQVFVDVTNTGNIHLKPDIDALIKDEKGNTIKKLQLKEGWPVFKGQSYIYTLQWWSPQLKEGQIYQLDTGVTYKDKLKEVERKDRFKFAGGRVIAIE